MSRRKTLQVVRTTGKAHGRRQADYLQALWDDLLSRQPGRVKAAFGTLDSSEQRAVRAHLERMVSESGWLPDQRISAQTALNALQDEKK